MVVVDMVLFVQSYELRPRVPVYASRVEQSLNELCFSGWSCHLSSFLAEFWIFLTVGIGIGLILTSLFYLKSAKTNVEQESSRTRAEHDAFVKFGRSVAELQVGLSLNSGNSAVGGAVTLASSPTKSAELVEVRNAYQNTVMAVPHHEEEYGEPLEENMAIEFGKDVAESVSNGTELTPLLQQVLVSKANKAANDRQFLIQTISRERESLREAEETCTEIQEALSKYHPHKLKAADYSILTNRWEELEELECRCLEAIAVRQEHIRKEPLDGTAPGDKPSLFEYLYQTLDVDYPVLATGAKLQEQIRISRRTLAEVASSRP